jgi:hypothetical protein
MNILENLRGLVQAMNSQVKTVLLVAFLAILAVTVCRLFLAERRAARR